MEGKQQDIAAELSGISVTYPSGDVALHAVNLSVYRGECVLLCGRSGCGKTTITKCMNGIVPHFEMGTTRTGKAVVAGLDIDTTQMYELALKVGSVFQNPKSQFFNLTSDDEMAFGLESAGVDPDEIDRRVRAAVADLKAERLMHRNVVTMSGGEKQSLVYASVYAMDPDVFVLDEPTANLDAGAIEILRTQIAKTKAAGKTIVIAEHRLYFLSDIIDRAILIEDGRVVREFTRDEFTALSEEERHALGLRTLSDSSSLTTVISSEDHMRGGPCSGQRGSGLEVEGLSCAMMAKYQLPRGVSFTARHGEVLGIVGSNGSGKTTLLRCLAGLERGRKGHVRFDGKVLDRSASNQASYLIMQDVNHQLFSDSVENECRLAAPSASSARIDGVLQSLDLLHLKERHPMALSGGQKQRLAIATGLLAEKRILLFDEPTSGLDFDHMVGVSKLMQDLKTRAVAIVVATHDREFLSRACDRVLDISDLLLGRVGGGV